MNNEGVKSEGMTPFQWLKEKEMKDKKHEAEKDMTQSARDKALQEDVDKFMFEQVDLWLRMNQGLMSKHRAIVIE